MPASIIFGGQYGSEGKGKVAYFWSKYLSSKVAVRVGGSNSGHTVYHNGKKYVFRVLPTPSLQKGVISVLPAGTYLDLDILKEEINSLGINPDVLRIDPNAIIIQDIHKRKEAELSLKESIGSTLSGTGMAVAARVMRGNLEPVVSAKDIEELKPYLCDTKALLRSYLENGENIVIEGTQGYGLSNYHAKAYPYATGRDTSAAGFLSEVGLSPLDVSYVLMVIRAFPIRVAGNSGPLVNEIDWETLSKEAGKNNFITERTTVTNKVRRVARFDPITVKDSIIANRPNKIVLNHIDYFDVAQKGKSFLSDCQKEHLLDIEKQIGQKIDFIGNGEDILIKSDEI